jgi:ABC-2 type transport system permease protein
MMTIFWYSLGRMRGQILGWGICLGLLGGYLISFYDTLADQQAQLIEMIKAYPPEMFAFFGDMTKLFTPGGYLNTEFFSYMPIILGIYVVLAGSGLLASDEESGTLDLVLAHPVSRAEIYFGRLAAFMTSLVAIHTVTWLGFWFFVPGTTLEITPGELALPFLSLLSLMVLFGALALLFSMLLPARSMAAMTSGLLLVASYFISSLAKIDEDLRQLAKFSPLNYYQGGEALAGMEWKWFLGLLGVALGCVLLAWWLFERRDIRVVGEGSIRLPILSRKGNRYAGFRD